MSSFHFLVVEDEPEMARVIRFYLERENFTVTTVDDGPSGEQAFRQISPDLLVLDIMLPGFDGLELCRRIRQNSVVPILMLTARAEDVDKAVGLGLGADDYLTKPFSPTEFIARVKALLRRAYQYQEQPTRKIVYSGQRLWLDVSSHEAKLDGTLLDLTPSEFKLLEILMANPGWAFTRSGLVEKIYGYDSEAEEDAITVIVSKLRQKLGSDGSQLVRTVRGVGYAYQE